MQETFSKIRYFQGGLPTNPEKISLIFFSCTKSLFMDKIMESKKTVLSRQQDILRRYFQDILKTAFLANLNSV